MNRPLRPEVLLAPIPDEQRPLPLETEGVLRYVWQARFGAMLIEVVGGEAFVNGQRVEPAPASSVRAASPPLASNDWSAP